MQPPNKALELTPRGGERDRVDFVGWKRLDCIPDLQGGAAQRQIVGRQPFIHPLLFTAFALSR
jgi:hypothetical protein